MAIRKTGWAIVGAVALMAAVALAGCETPQPAQRVARQGDGKSLDIYNWGDYIGEHTVADFEKATGIVVNYTTYDSNDHLEGVLMAGGSGHDLVVPTGPFFARQVKAGIYQEIDRSKLKNYGNIDPLILKAEAGFDPGNRYGVPYFWGTVGVGINVDMVRQRLGADAPVDSLDLLLKPANADKLRDCGIAMLDSPSDMFPTLLNYLGRDPHSIRVDDFAAVEKLMQSVRRDIRYFHSSNYINDLANGKLCAVIGWSGDTLIAASRAADAHNGVNIQYHIPKEGALIWVDILAIPKDAPNPDTALKFIDTLLEPKVAADGVNYITYASAVKPALLGTMINRTVLDTPGIYPTPEVKAKLIPDKVADTETWQLMRKSWMRIRAAP